MENKIAILGSGNMGLALANGLIQSGLYSPSSITLTRRNLALLESYKNEGFGVSNDNIAATGHANIIVLAVLPQQLNIVLDEIAEKIDTSKHLVISIISGVTCEAIRKRLNKEVQVVRVMPNTAIAIRQSMTCISVGNATPQNVELVREMFNTVGISVTINEDLMTSATALCACGIAFFLRSIRAASQGGVEVGFHAGEALQMAAQTAKGAADLLLQLASHPEQEIDKVTSPKGCTIAGLNEMEHNGFSSAMIKGVKLAAQKAGNLYKEE